ncbi:MAG: NADH-quinone oxidoreductase subunit C [Candidatus Adiutrix sp.]|jgi:NADH-quinone oxidoreductase subunit C|nr:NADH-quinone oxidoreductase subunit C [Candidatus Adiutrix sp.]
MTGLELYESWRRLGAKVICRHEFAKTGLTFSAVMPLPLVVPAAAGLLAAGYFLEDISAMQVQEGFLITYHYDSTAHPGRVAVRALADARGEAPSIASVYQGAEWHEREASDFLGIRFIGNPNPVPLLLPPDFPGRPPLWRAEGARASLAALGLFGQAEVLDPAWEPIVNPPAPAKEEKAEEAKAEKAKKGGAS